MNGFMEIEFAPHKYAARCEYAQLSPLPDDTLREAWSRAHAWLLTSVCDVLEKDGWALKRGDLRGEAVSTLTKPFDTKDIRDYGHSKTIEARVAIPERISVLFHPEIQWNQLFNVYALDARRIDTDSRTLYADAVHPCIADYFHLVQFLLPGLVALVCEEDIDDAGEDEYIDDPGQEITARLLPPADWIDGHRDVLVGILGDQHRFDDILAAATDTSRAFQVIFQCGGYSEGEDEEWTSRDGAFSDFEHLGYGGYSDDREDEELDLTACDKECGYCGRCPY
ncbi:hypothetical protein B0H17DRAFT_1214047 [Mycena rosella]|uniref:Uncharacterized protein n=1 Tax=Mycena rosella TaxID=1033263 RepID=A0AAD7CNT8_MYCRO|nr:hypothetical protein B0H17DRAFT_1214047 [Mycena rosella]